MKRYAPRPRRLRAYWDDEADLDGEATRSMTVHEPKDEPRETGLLDQHGNELMRLPPDRRPIGFLHVYEDEE